MTVDDLKIHYGVKTDSDVARILKHTRGAISKWRNRGIPPDTQARLQVITKGKLKADLEKLTA
ncbi:Cro/CI family transcriptional regulator [Acinetobacter sp. ANC 4636]